MGEEGRAESIKQALKSYLGMLDNHDALRSPSLERGRTLAERLEAATWAPTTEIDEDFPETTFLQSPET